MPKILEYFLKLEFKILIFNLNLTKNQSWRAEVERMKGKLYVDLCE